MAEQATLISRMRVLVARTYKAERLYASMRRGSGRSFPGSAALSAMANETRAGEWQEVHSKMRLALNDILEQNSSKELISLVLRLREEFRQISANSGSLFQERIEKLAESVKKEEFVHASKQSLELVKIKARLQASNAVVEELTGILSASGRKNLEIDSQAQAPIQLVGDTPLGEDLDIPEKIEANSGRLRNVIPFRRVVQGQK